MIWDFPDLTLFTLEITNKSFFPSDEDETMKRNWNNSHEFQFQLITFLLLRRAELNWVERASTFLLHFFLV